MNLSIAIKIKPDDPRHRVRRLRVGRYGNGVAPERGHSSLRLKAATPGKGTWGFGARRHVGEEVEAEDTGVKKSFAGRSWCGGAGIATEGAAGVPVLRLRAAAIPAHGLRGTGREAKADIRPFERNREGISGENIAQVAALSAPYGYRNRIMSRSQWNKPEQKLNIGFIRWECGLGEDITGMQDRRNRR